jgi:ubiquinone/menaquinone biosynthesis C-methylase UbiE
MPTSDHSQYIHGTHPEEQARLSLMNQVMNPRCLAAIGLRGGERVLDVASGLGQFTRALRQAAGPGGSALGIERDLAQLAQAQALANAAGEAAKVEFRQGSALALPLRPTEWGSFDVVHARFLLEHLPDPLPVVKQMAAAARPGGRVFLADDDHEMLFCCPEPPGFRAVWQAYCRTYDRLGNDPYIGRRLAGLLHEAKLTQLSNGFIFFGGCHGQPEFTLLCQNLHGILVGAREPILQIYAFTEAYFAQALHDFMAWAATPGAALWYPICYAQGVRPA